MARLTKAKSFRETLDPHLVELLLQAKDQILAAPDAFQMPYLVQSGPHECGAAFCIAGHMAILDDPAIVRKEDICIRETLIADWAEPLFESSEPWSMLFRSRHWPRRFPATPEGAAARIDYWLETGR